MRRRRSGTCGPSRIRDRPTPKDELSGYILHPVDLATNKVSAAGRFPGQSPEEMLAGVRRHIRFTAEGFRALALERPIDVSALHRRIRGMLDDAERFIAGIPSADVGVVFLRGGKTVQPGLAALQQYERRAGSAGGGWPGSPEIAHARLERYRNPSGG
jgi:hypothetical protein